VIGMDNRQWREFMDAAMGVPPGRVTVAAVRRRVIKRRVMGLGVPASAALAVVAVIVSFAGGLGGSSRPTASRPGGGSQQPVPALFNPLIPYAAFGWLPAGYSVVRGGNYPTADWLSAYGPGSQSGYLLDVHSQHRCDATAEQVQRQLAEHGRAQLNCAPSPLASSSHWLATGQAPSIGGRLAFWAGEDLVWQYAPSGWATLSGTSDRQQTLKVADNVHFGVSGPPIEFPFQLTGPLAKWPMKSGNSFVVFSSDRGVLGAQHLSLSDGTGAAEASINVGWEPANSSCRQAANRTVGGHRVSLAASPQSLCARDADGLFVVIFITGPGTPGVASAFADMRLLGPDPANWTTRPLA
jgi:hypothetical protein